MNIFNPPRKDLIEGGDRINENALVFMVRYRGKSILLPSDVFSNGEEELLNQYPRLILRADVLQSSHHGSDDANTKEFLDAVNPTRTVIASQTNRRGANFTPVLDRFDSANTNVYWTGVHGNIGFLIDEYGRLFPIVEKIDTADPEGLKEKYRDDWEPIIRQGRATQESGPQQNIPTITPKIAP